MKVVQPAHLKILIRCLTSLTRSEKTIEKLLSSQTKTIKHLIQLIRILMDEELVANSLKIFRNCTKDE